MRHDRFVNMRRNHRRKSNPRHFAGQQELQNLQLLPGRSKSREAILRQSGGVYTMDLINIDSSDPLVELILAN